MRLNASDVHSLLLLDLDAAGFLGEEYFPPSDRQVAMASLAKSFLKKFHNDVTSKDRDGLALATFLTCNEECRNYGILQPRNLKEELIVGELKSALYDFFNPQPGIVSCRGRKGFSIFRGREPLLLNLSDIAVRFGVGSGLSIGCPSGDGYSKFANSLMSFTDPVLPMMYRQAISVDPLLTSIENSRSGRYGYEEVSGNSLSFVPKNAKISRVICKEPLLNMLFQKGIGGLMEERLREVFSIDFTRQPTRNAEMAHVGSVRGDFGTIDLSSASDTISLNMLKQILPDQVMNWFMRTRSPCVTLPGGKKVDLHMVSSMGNAFTFPLQTTIFTCLLSAVYKVCGIPFRTPVQNRLKHGVYDPIDRTSTSRFNETHGTFSVFGDDIIVDYRVYDTVVDMLSLLGFTVNREKSFSTGPFRESCGHDYYDGQNVRGVYLQKLRSHLDIYSAINRLNFWSAKHGVPLQNTVSHLRKQCKFLAVPYDEGYDSGIQIPLSLHKRVRRDRNGSIKYQSYRALTAVFNVPRVHSYGEELPADGHTSEGDALPSFVYLSDGLLFAQLAGWLRSGNLTLRDKEVKVAVLRRRVCPGWDSLIPAYVERRRFRDAWKGAVEHNLGLSQV